MMIQGSDEWFAARLGKVTASRIADLMARTKTGWGAGRANYMAELLCERLTGQTSERFTNAAMQWGTDTEPQARAMYALETGSTVVECGFFDHPVIVMTGASPDGLVGDDGLVEIKCPNSATHIATLRGEPIADKYVKQMQWQMACTGRKWCDFVSYDPRMPVHLRLYKRRVERDDALISSLKKEVMAFLEELDGKITTLNAAAERLAA